MRAQPDVLARTDHFWRGAGGGRRSRCWERYGSVLSTLLINHILNIHHRVNAWVFRKKGDTNVGKEIILFMVFLMETAPCILMTRFGILLLSVCLEPTKRHDP